MRPVTLAAKPDAEFAPAGRRSLDSSAVTDLDASLISAGLQAGNTRPEQD